MISDEMKAVIVADSCWHSTRNLLSTWPPASAPTAHLLRLEPMDWQNARARGIRPWQWGVHLEQVSPNESLVKAELPPGWMKKFPSIGQWPLARACERWKQSLTPKPTSTSLWITYPHYLALADRIEPQSLIYYNLDDYTLYWPAKADQVRDWEARAVARADRTVCVAAERARTLRQAFPERADRILHLAHGAPLQTIPPEPHFEPGPAPAQFAHIPRPWLGYLGGLEDRLDWRLIDRIADRFPQASVVLVGPMPSLEGPEEWKLLARKAIARPNVYAAGPVKQERIGETYASFDVNLIPYDVNHPFNIACSPTKLLDAMGSGRPTVATDLPECLIHDRLYRVASSHEQFLEELDQLTTAGFRDGLEAERWKYAREHSTPVILDKLFRLS